MVAAVNCIFVSLLQISCTEQLLEVANDESIEDYTLHFHLDSIPPDDLFTLGKMHHFGASFHRILSCSAAEKLLIAVRGVNYLHFTQVVSTPKTCELCLLLCNRTTQYPSAVFLHGKMLYMEWENLFVHQSLFRGISTLGQWMGRWKRCYHLPLGKLASIV